VIQHPTGVGNQQGGCLRRDVDAGLVLYLLDEGFEDHLGSKEVALGQGVQVDHLVAHHRDTIQVCPDLLQTGRTDIHGAEGKGQIIRVDILCCGCRGDVDEGRIYVVDELQVFVNEIWM
jgi:hypothetical protein